MQLNRPDLLQTNAFINGQFVKANSGATFEVHNPFDHELLAEVADCGKAETEEAIQHAQDAFKIWNGYRAAKRSRILRRWYELQLEHVDDLARILTLEQGKPFTEAKGEIKYGASFVEWFAEEAKRVYGDTIPAQTTDKRIVVIKQAVGVCAAITPWNFPNAMITRKVAPALAAGCTVVIKPAELTPLSALALGVLAREAGMPDGVLNIVTTNDAETVGKVLTTHPTVKKISFTGSTEVGKILMKQASSTVKKVSLELGGNAPFIVFKDADIDAAIEGAIASKYRNAGQTCICTNRFFAHADVYDEFVKKLTKASADLTVGNGLEKGTDIGPMVEEDAVKSVEELLKDAKSKGATVKTGGSRANDAADTLLFPPTVLADATSEMDLFRTEIFGPIAAVLKFESEEEVIKMANDTPYGLAAYFYGNDYAQIWRVAETLEYGMVAINTGSISTAAAPFGGVKESGFGREGSKYGIEEYLNIKYLCWGL
ncbi:MAG: NAD-dependent succinate-semialdehyde dehydrogenase [Bacteroidota bacterium]